MIYLNVAGLSPFNQAVQQEVASTLEHFSRLLYSEEGIDYYRKTAKRCRHDLAHWLGVENVDCIAFVPNATTASWLVLSRINWKPGDHILTTTHENSTVRKEILGLHTYGVQVHTLDPQSPTELEAEIEHLLLSTQVRAIVISHVSHIDGRIFPIEGLYQLTQRHHALLIVDGAQAVGHIPVHFHDWQPDAYFFPGHKWCAGPMGTGALILGEKFVEHGEECRDWGQESSLPPWLDFELGTQNIGLIAGLAKACNVKRQEAITAPSNDGRRAVWKTCLQKHQGLHILEWDGPHSPGILSFTCVDANAEQFMQRTAITHSLSWKSFSHASFPSNLSIRLSWSIHSPHLEHSTALTFFNTL